MIGLSIPQIQHPLAGGILLLENDCGVRAKQFQGDGVVKNDGLE